MGNLFATELAMMENIELRQALSWHLAGNFYPPISADMIDPCIEAIQNANEGEWEKLVSLPEGVGYRGLTVAPTQAIIEQHRLESFLDFEDE